MRRTWEQDRSRFNHDWLKNQLISAVLKCKQVRLGLVANANAESDLVDRLKHWPEYRQIAQAVITQIEIILENESYSSLGFEYDDTASFIGLANEIERKRWIRDNNPQLALNAARAALVRMDYAVDSVFHSSLNGNADDLQPLLDEATKLSKSFAELSLCRQIALPA